MISKVLKKLLQGNTLEYNVLLEVKKSRDGMSNEAWLNMLDNEITKLAIPPKFKRSN